MSDEINHDRRRFIASVAVTIVAAQLGMIGSAAARFLIGEKSKAVP
jgi:hypothetical protein